MPRRNKQQEQEASDQALDKTFLNLYYSRESVEKAYFESLVSHPRVLNSSFPLSITIDHRLSASSDQEFSGVCQHVWRC